MLLHRTACLWLLDKLKKEHRLELGEYEYLIHWQSTETIYHAGDLAAALSRQYYGNKIFIRGLIEIGNACLNDCLCCGIRRSNESCVQYTLTRDQILACCERGYVLGFRTFVLHGGEGALSCDDICDIVSEIHRRYPLCAVTLALGEYPREDYEKMRHAGATRYLLCHDTADKEHYERLHPEEMSFDERMRCFQGLKALGFQTGCGFMVGSPYQTPQTLAKDLKFVEEFEPDLCGVDPFVPRKDTPLASFPHGTLLQTLYIISLIRLIRPNILLSSTMALDSIAENGRERGIQAGANVVMSTLSPLSVKGTDGLCDGKTDRSDAEKDLERLKRAMTRIGYEVVCSKGDIKK